MLATQPQGVATFPQHHHLTPYHHQHSSLLQAIQLPIAANSQSLTQIKSILTSSPASAAVTIPTQFISAVTQQQQQLQLQQQQQQQKSINTSSTYNSQLSISAATNQHPVTAIQTPNINNPSILSTVNSSMENPTGQLTPMAHPLSQSMDSVNTASNEEEVSQINVILNCAICIRYNCVLPCFPLKQMNEKL